MRGLIAWFMFCSLTGFGIVLPLAIGQNPEHEVLVYVLRAVGCAGFVIGLVLFFRSSGVSTPDASPAGEPDVVPRTLCNNPLAANHGAMPLAERIDMAVEASSAYARSFGVIFCNLQSYERIVRSHGGRTADAAMNFVLGMLQMLLRNTDRIERVGGGRFVICLVLLPGQETLRSVRERTVNALKAMRIEALQGAPITFDSGVAIYPADGKCGRDLLAHAQRDCEAAGERRVRKEAQTIAAATAGPRYAA